METLIVLGSIASYLLVGAVAGRIAFVVNMGDSYRWEHDVTKQPELARCWMNSSSDHDPATMGCDHKTAKYVDSLWLLWLMVFFWLLVTVFAIVFGAGSKLFKLLTRETRSERQRRLKNQREQEDEKTRQLAKELNLQLPNEISIEHDMDKPRMIYQAIRDLDRKIDTIETDF